MNTSKNARALRPSKPPMRELFIAYRVALPNKSNLNSGYEDRMAAPTVLGENVCRVALTENRLIPQSRIWQAKLLLQLFNDAGESLVDGPSVG